MMAAKEVALLHLKIAARHDSITSRGLFPKPRQKSAIARLNQIGSMKRNGLQNASTRPGPPKPVDPMIGHERAMMSRTSASVRCSNSSTVNSPKAVLSSQRINASESTCLVLKLSSVTMSMIQQRSSVVEAIHTHR